MSLNGLDDLKVKEAFDVASAEPGGWLLLKYAARDEIELLDRGNGGIVEIRNVIAKFEDPSPLFGLLRYRRRNVLIKYVPDACSRLVQARVAVHFSAVIEKFTPHDIVFPITTAKELRDTELSAACSLHTATGSTSSSTDSLRRRRLMEIAEDEEEEKKSNKEAPQDERPTTAKSPSVSGTEPYSSPSKREMLGNLPPSSSFLSTRTISSLETIPPPPRDSRNPTIPEIIPEPRKSSQSTRPEIYSYSSYGSNGKPKIKLAPRPSLDVGQRPHTSTAASFYRPISTLPQGIKMFSKGQKKDKSRPRSQYESEAPNVAFRPPPISEGNAKSQPPTSRPHTSGGRPNTSSGAYLRSPTSKISTMTPEKARLMKAMELRKKKNALPSKETTVSTPIEGLGSLETVQKRISSGAPKEVQDTLAMLDHMANGTDSAMAFDATPTIKTDESDATRSDSSPVSPIDGSEAAGSTKASSVSESTDETVQDAAGKKIPLSPELSKLESSDHHEQPHVESVEEVEEMKEAVPRSASIPVPHSAEVPAIDNTTLETALEQNDKFRASAFMETGSQNVDDEVSVEEDMEAATNISDTVSDLGEPSYSRSVLSHCVENAPKVELLEDMPPRIDILEVETEPATSQIIPIAKEWKVPRSKFSSQSLRGVDPPRSKFSTHEVTVDNGSTTVEDDLSTHSNRSTDTVSQQNSEERHSEDEGQALDSKDDGVLLFNVHKRRGFVEPINTDLGFDDEQTAESVNFSSDDDFMDELQSAVVQEAKPVSLPKTPMSPMTPTFSPKKKLNEENRFSRAFSVPLHDEESDSILLVPSSSPKSENTRAVSAGAAYLNRVGSKSSAKPLVKKANLGTGISQRIKALEKLSNTDATNTEVTRPVSSTSTAFFSVRKSGPRPSSSTQSIKDRADSLTRSTPSPVLSRESSPQTTSKVRHRSGSIQSRLEALNSSPNQLGHSNRESISVTARIVRDPGQAFQPKAGIGKDSSVLKPLDLKQSPLKIDHQRSTKLVKPRSPELALESRPSSASKTSKEHRSSITIMKDMINEKRSSFAERRRSITIESSENLKSSDNLRSPRPPSTHANPPSYKARTSTSSRQSISETMSPPRTSASFSPPPSIHSPISFEDKDRKTNRASRMIRRMSSSLLSGRKSLAHVISPTVREDPEPPMIRTQPSPAFLTPSSIPIGDVNVQFPDTLLWKRRCVLIDPHQGHLILSPAETATSNNKDKAALGATRRFHFGNFKRMPSTPDVEMQELPNSVVVELADGSGLQIACEDRAGQKVLLNVLQEAYRSLAASPR